MAHADVTVTVDRERDVVAINAWFQRWGPRIHCAEHRGCGCCFDRWRIEAPTEAFDELPAAMVTARSDRAA